MKADYIATLPTYYTTPGTKDKVGSPTNQVGVSVVYNYWNNFPSILAALGSEDIDSSVPMLSISRSVSGWRISVGYKSNEGPDAVMCVNDDHSVDFEITNPYLLESSHI